MQKCVIFDMKLLYFFSLYFFKNEITVIKKSHPKLINLIFLINFSSAIPYFLIILYKTDVLLG